MDPMSLDPQAGQIVAWVVQHYGGYGILLLVAWRWWVSVAAHACKVVPRVLDIVDNFIDKGVKLRIQLVHEHPEAEEDAEESATPLREVK